jgi:hypothetical protein
VKENEPQDRVETIELLEDYNEKETRKIIQSSPQAFSKVSC